MDFLRKQLEKFQEEVRGLITKLSFSQKISVLLLALVAVLSIFLVVNTYTTQEEYGKAFRFGSLEDAEKLKGVLSQYEIPFEEAESGDSFVVRVPPRFVNKARWIALQEGAFSTTQSNTDWLFESQSLATTSSRFTAQLAESKRRQVEGTLRWAKNVQDVSLTVNKGPEPIFSTETNTGDSASVSVRLARGAVRLSEKEVASIRLAVRGAFNILPQNIQVTDDKLNNYHFVETAIDGSYSEDENKTRQRIHQVMTGLYSRIFLPTEFVIAVLVDVSQNRSTVNEKKVGPAESAKRRTNTVTDTVQRPAGGDDGAVASAQAGIGSAPSQAAPSSGAAGRPGFATERREEKEAEYDNRFSETMTQTEIRPGELKGVSVRLVLDRKAVRRILQEEEATRQEGEEIEIEKITKFTVNGQADQTLDNAITNYLENQKNLIKDQLPHDVDPKVNVTTVMFPQPKPPEDTGMTAQATGWIGENWKDLTLGVLAVLGLFIVFSMLRRSLPAPLEIPTLEEDILVAEEQASRDDLDRLRQEIEAAKSGESVMIETLEVPGAPEDQAEQHNGSVAMVNDMTREKPEVVASVLKSWIKDSTKDDDFNS